MDHQGFAQLLGNYGEFIGAVAVVATLAYLAIQVRYSGATTLGLRKYWSLRSSWYSQPFASYFSAMIDQAEAERQGFAAADSECDTS